MFKISYNNYLDKVHGGWIGKAIGGTIGARVEGHKSLMDFTEDAAFPSEVPPNDDLDLQVLWLQVLEEKGIEIDSVDLADAWLKYCWYPFCEYGVFLKNYQLGIDPPVSGWFNNSFFRKSMGCPIRSEIWAFISPGNSELALEYARKDGCLDHDAEGVVGEEFLVALEALAFVTEDLNLLIEESLSLIPKDTELSRAIRLVIDAYEEGIPWKETRMRLLRNFGSPDHTYSIHNLGIIVMSLMYGEGDFGKSELIALNSGYDTDCTAATVGAIVGVIRGADNLPASWKDKMSDEYVTGIDLKPRSNKLFDLAQDTCQIGLQVAQSKNEKIRIVDVPGNFPEVRFRRDPLSIRLDYERLPSLGWQEKKHICITVTNNTSHSISATVAVDGPEHLKVTYEPQRLLIQPYVSREIKVNVQLKKEISFIPQKNLLDLSIKSEGSVLAEKRVGLAGAKVARVYGPYWDIYDTTKYSECPWYNENRIGRPRAGEGMINYVNIERRYLDEKKLIEGELSGGKVINFPEDKLDIDGHFGMYGPAAVYVVEEIICPSDRKAWLVVGSNDAYRYWLNSELVLENDNPRFYNPYNDYKIVKLKEGKNKVVVKVLRHSDRFEFSYAFATTEKSKEIPLYNQWVIDLASVIPKD